MQYFPRLVLRNHFQLSSSVNCQYLRLIEKIRRSVTFSEYLPTHVPSKTCALISCIKFVQCHWCSIAEFRVCLNVGGTSGHNTTESSPLHDSRRRQRIGAHES